MSIAMTLDAAGHMLSVYFGHMIHEQNIHSNVSEYVWFCMRQQDNKGLSNSSKLPKKMRANVIHSMQVTSHLCLMNICTKSSLTYDKHPMLQRLVWQQVHNIEIASTGKQIALQRTEICIEGI